jgi:hypothetical protein
MFVRVQFGDEAARVYAEGGIGFERRIRGVGWITNDRPGRLIARLALAVRAEMFPLLEPIGTSDIED